MTLTSLPQEQQELALNWWLALKPTSEALEMLHKQFGCKSTAREWIDFCSQNGPPYIAPALGNKLPERPSIWPR